MSRYRVQYSGFGSGVIPPVVKKLIIINIVMFLASMLAPQTIYYIGLFPYAVTHERWYWQFLTYMFMHGGFFHILFNMYALWLFGGEVERSMGSKPFLRFYLVTGIGAGIITYLFNIEARMPTVGASGAIFGILVAYAMMFPRNIILAFFIIPMRAWQFVIIFGLFELIASVSSGGSGGGIAYNAHLGGMAIGFLYIYFGRTVKYYWNGFMGQSDSDRRRKRIHSVVDTEEYIRNEIDPILDKISKYGMNSLTRKEKKKLRDAKDRLR